MVCAESISRFRVFGEKVSFSLIRIWRNPFFTKHQLHIFKPHVKKSNTDSKTIPLYSEVVHCSQVNAFFKYWHVPWMHFKHIPPNNLCSKLLIDENIQQYSSEKISAFLQFCMYAAIVQNLVSMSVYNHNHMSTFVREFICTSYNSQVLKTDEMITERII